MREIAFEDIRDAVDSEVVLATNAHALLTDLALPLTKQPLLHQHYPFIVGNLLHALEGQVLMAVCRLFDPDQNPHATSPTRRPPESCSAVSSCACSSFDRMASLVRLVFAGQV